MNVANRLGITLVLLVVIVLAVILALSPSALADPIQFLTALAEHRLDPFSQFVTSAVALVVAVVALGLLVVEWRRQPRRGVLVAKVPGGTAELASESVALRVKRAAEAVQGVRDASPSITSRGKAVDIVLRLTSDPDVDLPAKSREVMEAVRAEAETRMGIPVRSLKVSFKHSGGVSRFPSIPSDSPPG